MTESFYDLLGVPADADVDEIRRAYRQRIKETHPDVSDDPDASEKTARIVEARDILTDDDERARYDRLGHEAYVADGHGTSENGSKPWSSQAAADTASSSSSSEGPTNGRASAEERRRRERRAREDVDFGSEHSDERTARNGGTATTDATSNATAGTASGTTSAPGGTTDGGTAGRQRGGSSASATRGPPPWSNTEQGWAARSPTDPQPGLASQTVTAVQEAPGTATITFLLYPLLVLGAFFPPFPLLVNVIVGACLLAMIGAAQSVAGLGVAIYGAWAVLGAAGVIVAGENPFSPIGLVVLGTTWLPLGFSILTYHVLDS